MTIGEKILTLAGRQIGYQEIPKNSNMTKYGKWFGLNGLPWCGMFVSWCYAKAGFPLGKIGFYRGFAGCQTAVAHFTKTGEITVEPKPGCIVFYDFNKDGRYDHTGLFVEWLDEAKTSFRAVEGNTAIGNNSNGGAVMLRTRVMKSYGVLFVNPKVLGA